MQTILLIGEKQAGKTSACNFIKEKFTGVKSYNFADELKSAVHNLYGIPLDKMYGTENDKKELTHIKWEDMSNLIKSDKTGYMTIRELLQYFADVCKTLDPLCFVKSTKSRVNLENPNIAVIGDCRFINEINSFKDSIKIRCVLENNDTHSSENEFKQIPLKEFDLVLDKKNLTLDEKNDKIFNLLKYRGFN